MCSLVKFKWEKWCVSKCSEGLSNKVRLLEDTVYRPNEVCCLYDSFIYHILPYAFGSILYHCMYGCMFCMLLFNFVNYVFLLLCILIVMYVLFWVFCFICVLFVCKCVLYCCHWLSM
jgi:hypothetical protein